MAIGLLDKIKILKYLDSNGIDDLNYIDLKNAIANAKCKDKDVCVFLLDHIEKNLNEKSLNRKLFLKMLWMTDSLIEKKLFTLEQSLTTRLMNLPSLYDSYINRAMEEKDESIVFYFNKLESYKPTDISEIQNPTTSITVEVDELEKQINQLTALEQQYEDLRKKYEKQEGLLSDRNSKIKSLRTEIEQLKIIIQALQNTIREKIQSIRNLESQIKSLEQTTNDTIQMNDDTKRKYNSLLENVKELKETLASKNKTIQDMLSENLQKERQKQQENRIKDAILKKICEKTYYFENLSKELESEGYFLSSEQLFNLLLELNEEINIIDDRYYPPRYRISHPEIKTNRSLKIYTFQKKCYDIFLTSDFHISSLEDEAPYNEMYEYCSKNGIPLIINLGDFIDGLPYAEGKYSQKEYYDKLAEHIISKFPKSPNIHQFILGGNHDKIALNVGFDFLKMIAKERTDFTHIGYDVAKIYFNSDDIHPLLFHHFDKKIIDAQTILQNLNHYYSQNGLISDQVSLNFLGHLHKSGYHYSSNYCLVPSYTFDRYQNGAWHLKIYLNEDGTIQYMILLPLILLNNLLLPTSEIIHEPQFVKSIKSTRNRDTE